MPASKAPPGRGRKSVICALSGVPERRQHEPMSMPELKFNEDGLIPCIVQEATGSVPPRGRVLMMAWMNRQSLDLTLQSGLMHYWSRSRRKLWFKGESSGHTQRVVRWFADCDLDTLLFEVEQTTGACHTGYQSCFFQEYDLQGRPLEIREQPGFDPAVVYRA